MMATTKKAATKKTTARAKVPPAKAAKTGNSVRRLLFDDGQKIKVIGEHNRREGSRFHSGYEDLKKSPNIAAFRKKHPKDHQELLRSAVKDGFIKIA
jgi:hypothetical protein